MFIFYVTRKQNVKKKSDFKSDLRKGSELLKMHI